MESPVLACHPLTNYLGVFVHKHVGLNSWLVNSSLGKRKEGGARRGKVRFANAQSLGKHL